MFEGSISSKSFFREKIIDVRWDLQGIGFQKYFNVKKKKRVLGSGKRSVVLSVRRLPTLPSVTGY